jgi:ABC-2 type transport system ATP-binding protein
MLCIRNLVKSYQNNQPILKNLNLTVHNGLFGLLGPNGAGKSSLMRTIATLQSPDSGSITFNDQDVLKRPEYMRANLGYLPQEYGVYPGISANDLLHYLASLKGISERRQRQQHIDHLLAQVNLFQHKHQAVSQFSGGMKQRFGIAQAMLGEPKILIVDEPTAGLDPQERNRFHNLLAEISTNKVVILSTHIVEDVNNLCSQMAILAAGEIIKQGHPAKLQQALAGQVWRGNINNAEVAAFASQFQVISQRMVAGKTVLHVLSDQCPTNAFELIAADLEDSYFAALNTSLAQEH